jgi:DNA recombination protein RmuC
VARALRGRLSGIAQPTYVLDIPGGHGKVPAAAAWIEPDGDGWRVEDQARGAAEIARVARELYKRLSDMGGHVAGVGKALTQAVERYNQVVGSLESRVLPQARRFEALGVDHEGKPMPELPHIEAGVRPLARPDPRAEDGTA